MFVLDHLLSLLIVVVVERAVMKAYPSISNTLILDIHVVDPIIIMFNVDLCIMKSVFIKT